MVGLAHFARSLSNSAVMWGWLSSILGLGANLLIAPFLLRALAPSELGLWYLFGSLSGIAAMLSASGFGPTICRLTGYLWVGAPKLEGMGIAQQAVTGQPNWQEIGRVFATARLVYGASALVLMLLLSTLGTAWISATGPWPVAPEIVYTSWLLCLAGSVTIGLAGRYAVFLEGVGEVRYSQRTQALSRLTQAVSMVVLLLAGLGLLGLAISAMLSAAVMLLAYRARIRIVLNPVLAKRYPHADIVNALAIMWPTSWRSGLVSVGAYFITNAGTLVCSWYLDLSTTARYNLTLQALRMSATVGGMWVAVVVPRINQLRARNAFAELHRLFVARVVLSTVTYWVLAVVATAAGPVVLAQLHARVTLLPPPLMLFMALYLFLELNHSSFSVLVSAENRVPFGPSAIISGFLITILSAALVGHVKLGLIGILIAQSSVQAAFNNWYWVYQGALTLRMSFRDFLVSIPVVVSGLAAEISLLGRFAARDQILTRE